MEKQIEEMSQIITKVCETKKIISSYKIAETIYAKGYRKASDVAEEILAEIEENFEQGYGGVIEFKKLLAELKKKYTKSEDTE